MRGPVWGGRRRARHGARLGVAAAAFLIALAVPAGAWADPPTPGLVAAYAFDEGAGSVAVDESGNGHFGTISGATWASGRYGGALSFNGTNASVLLGSLGTFYNSGFTLEAWVQKESANRKDVAVVGSWAGGGGPMLWVDHLATRYHVTLGSGMSGYLDSGRNPVAGQWQHLAATFDGTTARFYIDGSEVASRTASGGIGGSDIWRVGAYGSTPGGFFDGLIDEVRIYDRALSASELEADMDTPIGIANGSAPTIPGDLTATGATQTSISAGWNPSTDNNGVSGYILYLSGSQVATTTGTTFTFTGLSCSTAYQLGVEAYDATGNVSARALETVSTAPCPDPVGLVAAYPFDEGAGEVANDTSGRGHVGTITGATWATGLHGNALAFNGTDASVLLSGLGGFYQDGFTLEAWVRKASAKSDATVVGTWTSNGGPMLWVDHLAGRYHLTLGTSYSDYLDSGATPAVGQWQHVAATFDGTIARFFVDGSLVASRAVSGSIGGSTVWRIGAYGSSPAGFFDGLIDDVRIYDEALSAGEIQADMNEPAPPPDLAPPSAPGPPAATGGMGQVSLTWGAATDNVGVARYAVHRSTSPGFTPSDANRIAQPLGTSYTDIGLAAGAYHYQVTARDGAGNVGPVSSEASATVTADTISPTVAITSPSGGGTVDGPLTVSAAADDDQGVVGVQFELNGQNLGPEDRSSPFSAPWDTRGEVNEEYELTAVARDAAGNTTTSAPITVTVANDGVSTLGLRLAYGLDEGAGTLTADSSGSSRTGTFVGATWTAGRYGKAASLDGTGDEVDPPPLGTFYKTGFTYEAWVLKQSAKVDVAVVGSWSEGQSGGPMIWVDHATGRYRLTLGASFAGYLDSGRSPAIGRWQHVAATYDGTTARIYLDGVERASKVFTGNVGNSNVWRIGAYGVSPTGFFDGAIDDVRIYDRALTPSEIEAALATRIQPDRTPPAVASSAPPDGESEVGVGDPVAATFDEPMQAATITASSFELRDPAGNAVPASVSYDQAANVATLTPQVALAFGTVYTPVVEAGGPKDLAGNALAADVSWSFSTEASSPRVLALGSSENPFSRYLREILRNEGLNGFTALDVALLSPTLLASYDVVVLGEIPLTTAQVSTLATWVTQGGNLIAMRPDKKLASLLGLTDTGTTLSNAYLKAQGSGIVGSTIQFHGTADRYTLNGATAVGTLYSNATTATANPAVTLRSVGASGGQAAAFTYDLARSVVLTRQGNPAWAGQERDGVPGIRPSDMFYGAKVGDVQPDWINTQKIAIPQADEQQRLLVNLITKMARDRLPVPRFWYLPRAEKAVVVLSGDDHAPDHAPGGTATIFDQLKALGPPGCVVEDWDCVRASSYLFAVNPLTDAQAAGYVADGFEIALHTDFGSCPTGPIPQAELAAGFGAQLSGFAAAYPSVPAPVSNRTHCVFWPDWASEAKVERAAGIRMDANYYHYPPNWIGSTQGFLNGGGFPMRFADLDGTTIDVYQQNTNLTDESTNQFEAAIGTLLDRALGSQEYYGAFGVNLHTDNPGPSQPYADLVGAALARGVPVISYRQLLEWVDGRSNSTIKGLGWVSGTLTFTTTVGPGANGLRTMLPVLGPAGRTLSGITRSGAPVPYQVQTIKGIQYALFAAANGTHVATYS